METQLTAFARSRGVLIEYFSALESTNLTARELRYGEGDVVIAESQWGGRGQRGNRWESLPGENLTFSLVLCPLFLEPEQQFYLAKVVALALVDLLREMGLDVAVKWPNDIYIRGNKVAGVLIEHDLMGPSIGRSIIGIGLNVNQLEFDPALPNPTSLRQETGQQWDRFALFAALYNHLRARYLTLYAATEEAPESSGEDVQRTGIDADYLAALYRLGEEHTYLDGKTRAPFRGSIRGVLPTGELEVEHHPGGQRVHYLFKEIEYT